MSLYFSALLGAHATAIENSACRFPELTSLRRELMALWTWSLGDHSPTGVRYYHEINRALRAGWPATEYDQLIAHLDRAIDAIEAVPGTYYRGVSVPLSEAEIARLYRIRTEHSWEAFTSTTTVRSKAYHGNVLFVIEGYNGRPIGPFSANPSEHEVLFRRRSHFRVLDFEARAASEQKSASFVVLLEEI